MYNELLRIGGVTIYGYGLMLALGVLACFFMADRRARKYDLDPDVIFNAGFISILVGFAGAKLLYIIIDLPRIISSADPWRAVLNGGMIVYGGLIGGVLCAFVYFRCKKVPFLPYFDLAAPSIAIAQAVGRLGCLLAGCCYGCPTDTALSITFVNSRYAPNHVSLVPTQIISSLGNFAIMAVLLVYAKKRPKAGRVGALYIILYAVGRFALEYLRDDFRGYWGPLSTSQWIAILLLPLGIWLFVQAKKREAAKEEMAREKARLRALHLGQRDALSDEERGEKSRLIIDRLTELEQYRAATVILTYVEDGSEVVTSAWIGQLLEQKAKRVFCPKVTASSGTDGGAVSAAMEFYEISALDQLGPGFQGIREPLIADGSGTTVFGSAIYRKEKCLMVLPGVVFDSRGGRIGRGRGFYDRYLRRFPGLKTLALAYDCQMANAVPMGLTDVRVASVVTEDD